MTDTELILSKIDELRTELKGDIAVLDTKIEAVQLGIVKLNDKLEFIEYVLQREIESRRKHGLHGVVDGAEIALPHPQSQPESLV